MVISFIIPAYNAAWNIKPLLTSILNQSRPDDEIIVVDDASRDQTAACAREYAPYGVQVISLEKNLGPAAARNRGAKEARGKYLFFLDADTRLEPGSVAALCQLLQAHPEIKCVNGISRKGIDTSLSAQYKALVEYSWVCDLPENFDRSTFFNPRVGAIERGLFLEAGGFNESYKRPAVEDYELGYRILGRAKVYLNHRLGARHNFGSFRHITRDYFQRTLPWLRLFAKRKKFDSEGTSLSSAAEYTAGALALLLTVFSFAFPKGWAWALVAWFLFLVQARTLWTLSLREKGRRMTLLILLCHLYFSAVIVGSVFFGFSVLLWERFQMKSSPL